MTIKTRLNKIENHVNKITGGDRMPVQSIFAESNEDLRQKLSELKEKYGEERYEKSLIIVRPEGAQEPCAMIL